LPACLPWLPSLPLLVMVKNMSMKSVCSQCYDRSSLAGCVANVMIGLLWTFTCRWYYWSPVVKWLFSFCHVALYDPPNETLWQYYHVVPSLFYQLMLERRCQSLG
jgi:hypothetical protein